MPRLACPDCRAVLDGDADRGWWCSNCGRRFAHTGGIHRLLPCCGPLPSDAFLRQYRAVRERDGHRQPAPDYYRMLPMVPRDHPRADEWRIRRESYANLQSFGMPGVWRGPIRVLDVGAGSGWLSHRLASFGHFVTALDRLDDDMDGLGAIRHYPVAFPAVQADFNALPFPDREFDLVVLNGSLHYAVDPARTLAEARRVMAIGGALVVMDSPMFADARDGRTMVDAQLRAFAVDYGIVDAEQPGAGYLTYAALERAGATLGLASRFIPSRGPLAWRLRRQMGRVRLGRAPAAFGVWVAQ